MSFTKLHSSILDSSIWLEDDRTVRVWITLMAMADRDGMVEASVPGLAYRARVPRKSCERALEIFLAPDPDSRTPDHDGRRIEKVPGGWRLLNYEPYREKDSAEQVREKNAERQQRWRDRHREPVTSRNVTGVTERDNNVTVTPPSASGSASPSGDLTPSSQPPERAPARSEDRAELWDGGEWLRRFSAAWAASRGVQAYGITDADYRAHGKLQGTLVGLSAADRLAAQRDADRMFAAFFAQGGRAAEMGHPFYFFAPAFNGLRGQAKASPARDVRVGHAQAEVTERPTGEVAL